MNTTTIVAGLDIGTTKIVAIVARRTESGQIEILGIGKSESNGVMRGVISNIDKTVHAIHQAVSTASKRSGVAIHNVYVGIAGQHIRSLQHRGYLMRNHDADEIAYSDIRRLIADMYKLVLPPGDRIIHVLPQEFTVDNEQGIKDPIGMSGVRLEADFHIITGQIAAAKNINRCVEKGNLKVNELILEPIASAASVLSDEELEAGVALVDIGGGTTDVAIFQEGIIRHTAVIPLGGNIITEDIREGCMVMKEQAEKLKVKFGSAIASEAQENAIVSIPGLRSRSPKEISLKNLAHIIQARMEEILEYVYYEIKRSGFENKLIGGIVITGGGAKLRHLKYLAEYVTGLDARIGRPTEHVSNVREDTELNNPLYATAIGLAIRALDEDDPVAADYQERVVMPIPEPVPEPENIEEPVFESVAYEEEQQQYETAKQTKETKQNNDSWFDSLFRKGREWLEGDVNDFN